MRAIDIHSSEVPALGISDLSVRYGNADVVKAIDVTASSGEIVSLLGPSGCGKTSTLRAIGGFVVPSQGTIRLKGRDITKLPPEKRGIGLVFQGYALFPHMNVFENVAYGLRVRKVPRKELAERVRKALAMVRLDGFADRWPRQLSGGQQQRVAIARAVVTEPAVLLMDEPLSNLDAKLRYDMGRELRQLLKQINTATVLVTHDQEEAMVLSDRIVLMNAGVIEQQGIPAELYNHPKTRFVAHFLGNANHLSGVVRSVSGTGEASLAVEGATVSGIAAGSLSVGESATIIIKHEQVLVGKSDLPNQLTGIVESVDFLGSSLRYVCRIGQQTMTGILPNNPAEPVGLVLGEPVLLSWPSQVGIIFGRT